MKYALEDSKLRGVCDAEQSEEDRDAVLESMNEYAALFQEWDNGPELPCCQDCKYFVPYFWPMDGDECEGEPTGCGNCLNLHSHAGDDVSDCEYCGYFEAKP